MGSHVSPGKPRRLHPDSQRSRRLTTLFGTGASGPIRPELTSSDGPENSAATTSLEIEKGKRIARPPRRVNSLKWPEKGKRTEAWVFSKTKVEREKKPRKEAKKGRLEKTKLMEAAAVPTKKEGKPADRIEQARPPRRAKPCPRKANG